MGRLILNLINDAEATLGDSLHRADLDATARTHLDRALAHVREAVIATNELGKARTVGQLVHDCEAFDRLLVKVRERQEPGAVTLKLKV